jgi:hypothetical protein
MPDERTTWERFFEAHASIYEDNVFARSTSAFSRHCSGQDRERPGGP